MSSETTQTKTRATAMALAAGGSVAAWAFFRRTKLFRWGASDEEIADSPPGDNLIGDANLTATRAISVRRSPDFVWPWIAQLGQARGGFYSCNSAATAARARGKRSRYDPAAFVRI